MSATAWNLWATYAASYLVRKPVSLVKSDLRLSGVTGAQLVLIDTAFLLPYAVVQLLFAGRCVEAFRARTVFFGAVVLAAVFTSSAWPGFGVAWTVLCCFASGSLLSVTWPAACKILSDVAEPGTSQLDGDFRLLATSPFVGGFVATLLAMFFHVSTG
jgi:sugar phosphate permease